MKKIFFIIPAVVLILGFNAGRGAFADDPEEPEICNNSSQDFCPNERFYTHCGEHNSGAGIYGRCIPWTFTPSGGWYCKCEAPGEPN